MIESSLIEALGTAFSSPKSVIAPTSWVAGRSAEQLRALVQLDCLEGEIAFAFLHVVASRPAVDRDVSFTLQVTVEARDYRLWRLDWRPPSPHVNRHRETSRRLRGVTSLTGIHDFSANMGLGLDEMQRMNLPVCEPLEPEPRSFFSALALVCDRLKIDPKIEMEEPPWTPILL